MLNKNYQKVHVEYKKTEKNTFFIYRVNLLCKGGDTYLNKDR